MAASYPASIKSFSAKANGDYVLLTHVTDLEAEVVAIETALKTGPTALASASLSGATASQAVFTNGSKELVSNAITGTGNVVMSASPTLTGTIAAAAATFSTPLVVSSGGTGLGTLTNKSVLVGAGTGTVASVAPGSSGNVLTSDGTDWASTAVAASVTDLGICEGRLTLTSALPVTTADVTGATNIYFAPYKGNRIALYDGSSAWNVRTFTQITIALGTLTDAKPYDLFAYDNSGTVTFDAPLVWTDDTTRATALTTQDGVLVKNGATTRRYIGTFYTTATTTTEDSLNKRLLWNYYNRVGRSLYRNDSGSHTYTLGTWRQFDADTANQLVLMQGVAEDLVTVAVACHGYNSQAASFGAISIGLDSTSGVHANATIPEPYINHASYQVYMTADLTVNIGLGWHKLVWLQRSQAAGTYTYFPSAAAGVERGGMTGFCWA